MQSKQNVLSPYRLFFKKGYVRIKPLSDYFLAIIALIITIPVFFIVGVMIKLTSSGPVFYFQERIGKDGRVFRVIKFRTMNVDAESWIGPVWAKKDDTRITPVGRILRKMHIDELPQLINVIKGEMGMVGPRPERPFFVKKFNEDISGYAKRLSVKPGITGLAQCLHKYDETIRDVKNKLRYDLIYIEKMCWMLDLKIFYLTLRLSIFGKMVKVKGN